MYFLLASLPPALVALVTAILVPTLFRQVLPGTRFEPFLPLVVFLAAREPLWLAIPAAWILGALGDHMNGLPAGAGIFSLQLLVIAIHFSTRWIQFRSAASFALFVIPATLVHLYLQYLVLVIVGRRALLEWGLTLPVALWTALWALAVWYLVEGAARLIGRWARPAEERGGGGG